MPDFAPQPPESSSSTQRQRHTSFGRTENIRCLLDNQTLAEHVRSVIDFMKSIKINLLLFLWALSWNIPELVSDLDVTAERTALMLSDELLGILSHWCCPPRRHGFGICTKGAYETMNKFALDSVLELIKDEMGELEDELSSPQSDLSEETVLSIKWKDLIASV